MSIEPVTSVVDPVALSDDELDLLVEDLFHAHRRIFANARRQDFKSYVYQEGTARTRIERSADPTTGESVGYAIVHFYERTFRGRPCTIVRTAVGLLRRYRGRGSGTSFLAKEISRRRLSHPTHDIYGVNFVVHPSSYVMLTRYASEFYPTWNAETPEDVRDFVVGLAKDFELPQVDPKNRPLVVDAGWATEETDEERRWWHRSKNPAVRFYLQQNPDYAKAHALAVFCRMNASDIVRGLGLFGQRRFDVYMQRARTALQSLAIGTTVARQEASAKLAAIPEFTAVPADAITELARRCEQRSFAAGSAIVEKGDVASKVYVLVKGSAFVVLPGDDEEIIVGEHDEGALFGEMGALLGRRRTATVRAAGHVHTLCLPAPMLLDVANRYPSLAQTLWDIVGIRLLELTLIRSRIQLPERCTAARTLVHLPAGSSWRSDSAGLVFVVRGRAEGSLDSQPAGIGTESIIGWRQNAALSSDEGAVLMAMPPLDA